MGGTGGSSSGRGTVEAGVHLVRVLGEWVVGITWGNTQTHVFHRHSFFFSWRRTDKCAA